MEENITPPGFAIMLTQTVLSIKLVSLQAAMSHLILDQQQHPDQTHPRIRRKVLNLNSPVSLLTQGVLLISDSNLVASLL